MSIAALSLAHNTLHLSRVVVVRLRRGFERMPPLQGYPDSDVIMWLRGAGSDSLVSFVPRRGDLAAHFPAKSLALELEKVDNGSCALTEACFIQFASVGADCVSQILKIASTIPLLGVLAHLVLNPSTLRSRRRRKAS